MLWDNAILKAITLSGLNSFLVQFNVIFVKLHCFVVMTWKGAVYNKFKKDDK